MSKQNDPNPDLVNMRLLLEKERAHMLDRRSKTGKSLDIDKDSLGIALSGGGIRSATICMGILERLNKKGILQQTDYLSSVSGGGYIASYIHSTLHHQLAEPNTSTQSVYDNLFCADDQKHLMKYREYLFVWRGKGFQRIVSNIYLFFIALIGTVSHSLWWVMPLVYRWVVARCDYMPETHWWVHFVIMFIIATVFGMVMSPNFTSPHRFYKRRLRKAYLIYGQELKLWQLNHPEAPYPILNAAITVNYDKYNRASNITYRGPIKSNYFIFTPLYCGSQVTNYTTSNSTTYKSVSLATAMATSAAAVNTFMGNFKLPFLIRQIMALANLRTGILAPNPQLTIRPPAWWPYYTFQEVMGTSDTTKNYIQVSDGGHIENLGIYELLRRKTKVIIAVDAGEDNDFKFEDLRNLVVRARNELGLTIEFHPKAKPHDVIQPDVSNGFSDRYFVVAKIKAMKGAYHKDYDGILIYIKSALIPFSSFEMRNIKNMFKRLIEEGRPVEATAAKLKLDSYTYRTYNPQFPHEPTVDQFFDEAQWSAYHDLGLEMGQKVCDALQIEKGDSGSTIFEKGLACYEGYG
jgi:Patatin-like phospholipase